MINLSDNSSDYEKKFKLIFSSITERLTAQKCSKKSYIFKLFYEIVTYPYRVLIEQPKYLNEFKGRIKQIALDNQVNNDDLTTLDHKKCFLKETISIQSFLSDKKILLNFPNKQPPLRLSVILSTIEEKISNYEAQAKKQSNSPSPQLASSASQPTFPSQSQLTPLSTNQPTPSSITPPTFSSSKSQPNLSPNNLPSLAFSSKSESNFLSRGERTHTVAALFNAEADAKARESSSSSKMEETNFEYFVERTNVKNPEISNLYKVAMAVGAIALSGISLYAYYTYYNSENIPGSDLIADQTNALIPFAEDYFKDIAFDDNKLPDLDLYRHTFKQHPITEEDTNRDATVALLAITTGVVGTTALAAIQGIKSLWGAFFKSSETDSSLEEPESAKQPHTEPASPDKAIDTITSLSTVPKPFSLSRKDSRKAINSFTQAGVLKRKKISMKDKFQQQKKTLNLTQTFSLINASTSQLPLSAAINNDQISNQDLVTLLPPPPSAPSLSPIIDIFNPTPPPSPTLKKSHVHTPQSPSSTTSEPNTQNNSSSSTTATFDSNQPNDDQPSSRPIKQMRNMETQTLSFIKKTIEIGIQTLPLLKKKIELGTQTEPLINTPTAQLPFSATANDDPNFKNIKQMRTMETQTEPFIDTLPSQGQKIFNPQPPPPPPPPPPSQSISSISKSQNALSSDSSTTSTFDPSQLMGRRDNLQPVSKDGTLPATPRQQSSNFRDLTSQQVIDVKNNLKPVIKDETQPSSTPKDEITDFRGLSSQKVTEQKSKLRPVNKDEPHPSATLEKPKTEEQILIDSLAVSLNSRRIQVEPIDDDDNEEWEDNF